MWSKCRLLQQFRGSTLSPVFVALNPPLKESLPLLSKLLSQTEEKPVFPFEIQQESVLSPYTQGLGIPVFEYFFFYFHYTTRKKKTLLRPRAGTHPAPPAGVSPSTRESLFLCLSNNRCFSSRSFTPQHTHSCIAARRHSCTPEVNTQACG